MVFGLYLYLSGICYNFIALLLATRFVLLNVVYCFLNVEQLLSVVDITFGWFNIFFLNLVLAVSDVIFRYTLCHCLDSFMLFSSF